MRDLRLKQWLLLGVASGISTSALSQTVYRWTADNADFGEVESTWNNAGSWAGSVAPPIPLTNSGDIIELNGDGGNGFGSNTKEITIDNTVSGIPQIGTLRYGDRDHGSAVVLEDRDGNPATGSDVILFSTTANGVAAQSDGIPAAIFHGMDNFGTLDARGTLSVGSDNTYGNSGDAIELSINVDDLDGFLFDGFYNLRIDGPMTDLNAGTGGSDFIKRGQGILFFDENSDSLTTNGSFFGFKDVLLEEGELRLDGDNGNPDGPANMQIQGDLVIGTGGTSIEDALAARVRSALPTMRFRRINAAGGPNVLQDAYSGVPGTSEIGGDILLDRGVLWFENGNVGGGAAEWQVLPDIIVSGNSNKLYLTRENNNSEAVRFDGAITGSGELFVDGSARGVFTADNTFTGVFGIAQQSDDNGGNLGGVELAGASGAISGASEIRIFNNGTLFLENSNTLTDGDGALASLVGAVNNDRIGDSIPIYLQDLGRIEVVGNQAATVTETLGDITVLNGRPALEFDLNNGTNANQIELTINSITRNPATEFRIRVEDGYTAGLDGSQYQITLADGGAALGANVVGGSGAAGTTTMDVVRGVTIDISNNWGSRIATIDPATNELRVLDHDPASPGFEFLDATGQMSGSGTQQLFDSSWNGTNGTNQNVMWYFTQNIAQTSGTPANVEAEQGRVIFDDITINSAYITGLANNQQGGNDNLRRGLLIDQDATLTIQSGVLMVGRQTSSNDIINANEDRTTNATNDLFITGGTINLGQEGFIKNRNNNLTTITSDIVTGSGGLTVSTPNWTYFEGNLDLGGGNLTIMEGAFHFRNDASISNINEVHLEGTGGFYLRDGVALDGLTIRTAPNNNSTTGGTVTILRTEGNAGATLSNSNIILSSFDRMGETFGTQQITQQVGTLLNLENVNIFQNDPVSQVTSDFNQADPTTFQFVGETSVINFNGILSDVQIGLGENGTGALAPMNPNDLQNTDNDDGTTPLQMITSNGFGASGGIHNPLNQENDFLRVRIDGNNSSDDRFNPFNGNSENFNVNFEQSGQQFNGQLVVGHGILRFTSTDDAGDGVTDGQINFFHDEVVNSRDFRDFWTSFRLVDDITGNDNRAVVMLTQDGQVFNINGGESRADVDTNEDNFAMFGYGGLTGTGTIGDQNYNIGGGFGKRLRADREVLFYAAGDKDTQGTLAFRMGIRDDNGRDSEATKLGRGILLFQNNALNVDEGNGTWEFDHGHNLFGGETHYDFNFAGDNDREFTSSDTNAASTPDMRFQGGAFRILGDTNQTRIWNNIDGDLIVNFGGGEMEYRAAGGTATLTAGGASSSIVRTAGGALNFVVDSTNIGGGAFTWTWQNDTVAAGSADNVFDSRIGGSFTYGTAANTVNNWAAFDDGFELGELAATAFNNGAGAGAGLAAFGSGFHTQIEDAAVSTGGATATGSIKIDAASALTVDAGASTFTVEDGILIPTANAGAVSIAANAVGDVLTGTVLTGATTSNELLVQNYGSGGLDIQIPVVDNGAKTDLTIHGTGTTTLSAVNTHTGNTYVSGGSTLNIDADSDLGTFDVTNGYGIHDILIYRGGDNYDTDGGGFQFELKPKLGSVLTGSEVAPTTTVEISNNAQMRNIRVTAAGSGYVERPIAVFEDLADSNAGGTGGTNHGQGARAAVVFDGGNLVLNGGAIKANASFEIDEDRSIVLGGDGGTINIADSEVLTYQGFIVPERHTSRNNDGSTYADYFSGDLDINADGSTGTLRLGRLIADGDDTTIAEGGLNNVYDGMTNVYGGTVEWFGQPYETNDGDVNSNSSQAYITPFGMSGSPENGTILHEDATLRIMFNAGSNAASAYDGGANNGNNNLNDTVRIYEWFTLKNGAFIQEGTPGATEQDANTGRNISLDGVITIEDNSNAFVQSEGGNEFLFNFYGGELIGSETTRLVKLGDNNLRMGAPQDNFLGQFVVVDGILEFNSHGNVDGAGTSDILIGGNLTNPIYTGLANPISLPSNVRSNEGTGNVGIYIRDDGATPGNTIEVNRNIRFVSDGVVGTTNIDNTYRIGAWFMADTDRALYSGNIDTTDISTGSDNEQIQFYYRDDVTSRNNGSVTQMERAFIEFSGDITGGANARTVIEQGGNGNGTSQADELDYHAYFVFSGDNSNWGSASDRITMEIGLRSNTIDTDRTTYWRAGSDTAFNEYQNMALKMGSRLQTGGHNVTIGSLISDADNGGNNNTTVPQEGGVANDGAGTFYAFLENGSNTEGTITIRQTGDHRFTGLIRNGFDPLTSSASGELAGEVNIASESGSTEGAALNIVYDAPDAETNLTLTTANTYTGTTTVNNGILQVGYLGDGTFGEATGSGGDEVGRSGTGLVNVNGGRLAGSGQVQGNLTLTSGIITPGDENTGTDEVGTLFVGGPGNVGNFTMNGGTLLLGADTTSAQDFTNLGDPLTNPDYAYTSANYAATVTESYILGQVPATDLEFFNTQLDPASFGEALSGIPAFEHDHLEIGNDLTWNGGTIKVDVATAEAFALGQVFNLIDWFGTANWNGFNEGANFRPGGSGGGDLDLPDLTAALGYDGSWVWDTQYFKSSGVVFIVAPEPSRMLLFGLGLMALILRRRRA